MYDAKAIKLEYSESIMEQDRSIEKIKSFYKQKKLIIVTSCHVFKGDILI